MAQWFSRQLRLAAVVGVRHATRLIPDGQRIPAATELTGTSRFCLNSQFPHREGSNGAAAGTFLAAFVVLPQPSVNPARRWSPTHVNVKP